MAKDLYNILGVSKSATEDEIKKAYRKAAIKYHPDRQAGKSDAEKKAAEEKFKDISHAYEVLSDPTKKSNYDQFGDENGMQGMPGGNPFGDMFHGFNPFGGFSGFGSRRRQNAVIPGRDIQMKIPVSIKDIFNGATRTVKFKKQVRCTSCHGAGGSGQKACPKCNGTGRIIEQTSFGMGGISIREETCPLCGGTGFYVEKKCDKCGGSGFDRVEVHQEINIPSGVQPNEAIVIKGQGSESKNPSGQNGDFVAIADYKIDTDRYEITGLDVLEHVHIPWYKLLYGCSYTVNIPNGTEKKIKIASCTKEGTIMKLSGEGLKRSGYPTGNYFVCIHYQIPDKLTDKEKELLAQLNNN